MACKDCPSFRHGHCDAINATVEPSGPNILYPACFKNGAAKDYEHERERRKQHIRMPDWDLLLREG